MSSSCASSTNRRRASWPGSLEADHGIARILPPHARHGDLAKERLRIIVAQERTHRGGPDYLPLLRGELLEVIRKYIKVDPDAVQINLEKEDGQEVLELSVALPEKGAA